MNELLNEYSYDIDLLKSIDFKVREVDLETQTEQAQRNQLIQTIRPDRKLHYLTDRLPQSNYQNGLQYERSTAKMTPGGRTKGTSSQSYGIRNVNLPKLERIIVKGTANKNPVMYHQVNNKQNIRTQKP